MSNITYISDGKALEYTLPDGYNADYIALIPAGANGKITLINGTDYINSHGVIRFFRVPPEGAAITFSNDINTIITADTENDLSNEVAERIALSTALEYTAGKAEQNERKLESLTEAYRNTVDEGNITTTSFAGLSEASIITSLALSSIYERLRNMEQ